MKIRTKLVFVQVALLVFLSLGVLMTLYFFVLPGVESIERQSAQTDMDRAHNAITAEQDRLWVLARDWGVWDDAYQFIEGNNAEFVESNFDGDTLGGLHMDYMLIAKIDGSPVLSLFADETGSQQQAETLTKSIDAALIARINEQKYGLIHTDMGALVWHTY